MTVMISFGFRKTAVTPDILQKNSFTIFHIHSPTVWYVDWLAKQVTIGALQLYNLGARLRFKD